MSRATVWLPLKDPTPGDPVIVAAAGKRYTDIAGVIADQVNKLNTLADCGTNKGEYVKSLSANAEALKDHFNTLQERYKVVGGALTDWSGKLVGFQERAERLRQAAVAAQGNLDANRDAHKDTPPFDAAGPPPSAAVLDAANAKQRRFDHAEGEMGGVQRQLRDLEDEHGDEAHRIGDQIWTKSGQYNDDPWENFSNWMDDHAAGVKDFVKWMGVIAMVVVVVLVIVAVLAIPGVNVAVIAAIGTAASALSLAGNTALASTGNGSWTDVAIDGLGLVTFGAGKFLGPGMKVLGKTLGGKGGKLLRQAEELGVDGRRIKAMDREAIRNPRKDRGLTRAEAKVKGVKRRDQAWKAAQDPRTVPKGTWQQRAGATWRGGGDIAITKSRAVIASNADDMGRFGKSGPDTFSRATTYKNWEAGVTGFGNTQQVAAAGVMVANGRLTPLEAWRAKWTQTRSWGDLPGTAEQRQAERAK